MPVTEEQVLQALSQVRDPELHRDIVSLGMVRDVRIDGEKVAFELVLTTPACPFNEQMKEMAYEAVAKLPGVREVTLRLSAEVPKGVPDKTPLPGVKNIIAVGSGKGGVGKTTVAVNLAIALAKTGAKVGLLDADIYGPNVPRMMGVRRTPDYDEAEQKIVPLEAWGIKVMSLGFLLSEDQPVIWRGPILARALQQLLFDVRWGELDYLLVDLPPGCLTADTQVFTEFGPVPISEVTEGAKVYSFDGRLYRENAHAPWTLQGNLVKREVVAVIPQGKAQVYELRTATRTIKGTTDHPILTVQRTKRDGTRFYEYELTWKRLGEFKPGDIVVVIKKVPDDPEAHVRLPEVTSVTRKPVHLPEVVTDELARLLGYCLGDGFVRQTTGGKPWGVWFSEPANGKYRRQYMELVRSVFHLQRLHQQPQKFAVLSAAVAELFERLGLHKRALGKRVPPWVFALPTGQKRAFIEGYCDADGHRRAPKPQHRKPGWMTFESPNKSLMEDLQALSIYTGLKVSNLLSRVKRVRVPSTGQVVMKTLWSFEANASAKTDRYGAGLIQGTSVGRGLVHEFFGFERVREVRFIGLEEVYDLHVEGEHNFIANGFIVHNTGDVQLSLSQLVPVTGAVIVTTPQDVALYDAIKGMATFKRLNVPVLGVVENMSYFICPHCGERTEIFRRGVVEVECERRDVRFLGAVPVVPEICEGGDLGHPITAAYPESPAAQAFMNIASQLAASVSVYNLIKATVAST